MGCSSVYPEGSKKGPQAERPKGSPPACNPQESETSKHEHKWVYMQTARQCGQSAAYTSPQIKWKRVDRFYCEKCLEIKEIVKEAPGYYEKPEWFD